MTEVVIRRPVKRRPTFHPLRVEAVDRLTDDAVAVAFEVPELSDFQAITGVGAVEEVLLETDLARAEFSFRHQ